MSPEEMGILGTGVSDPEPVSAGRRFYVLGSGLLAGVRTSEAGDQYPGGTIVSPWRSRAAMPLEGGEIGESPLILEHFG